ncbi:hypothetical protein NV391_12000 [Companilactobacillus crustorum]|uniref:hypothetical protein n=1 Tax=Companilactobacillus crustorum TaxID=392416 RepID=UPI000EEF8327|nr:hypothetical protein [Companilactobacillus crustorum]WDT65661.1 hypothetical protein NV391_12000 [Companilactobacillus crustorum]HCD07393.1 hypothetical protein [Lactobacillus sp.]
MKIKSLGIILVLTTLLATGCTSNNSTGKKTNDTKVTATKAVKKQHEVAPVNYKDLNTDQIVALVAQSYFKNDINRDTGNYAHNYAYKYYADTQQYDFTSGSNFTAIFMIKDGKVNVTKDSRIMTGQVLVINDLIKKYYQTANDKKINKLIVQEMKNNYAQVFADDKSSQSTNTSNDNQDADNSNEDKTTESNQNQTDNEDSTTINIENKDQLLTYANQKLGNRNWILFDKDDEIGSWAVEANDGGSMTIYQIYPDGRIVKPN